MWVRALEDFEDDGGVERRAGDNWAVFGPRAYVPPVQVQRQRMMFCLVGIPALNIYIFPTAKTLLVVALMVCLFLYWCVSGIAAWWSAPAAVLDSAEAVVENITAAATAATAATANAVESATEL